MAGQVTTMPQARLEIINSESGWALLKLEPSNRR